LGRSGLGGPGARSGGLAAAYALLSGCGSNPADPSLQSDLTTAVAVVAVLAVFGFVMLAFWLTHSAARNKMGTEVGGPPRRRIGDWAFASEAPLEDLFIAIHSPRAEIRMEVSLELCRRLPSLPAEEFLSHSESERGSLYRSLDKADVELALAILDMASRSRDLAAQTSVASLFGRLELRKRTDEHLVGATAKCLHILAEAERHPGSILLRAAHAGADGVLLRPAQSGATTEPDQLLRASERRDD
jgi:hypothetical protein